MNHISSTAEQVARFWAVGRRPSPAVFRGIALQAQDHLEHGADPDYLIEVARWMAAEQRSWLDLDAAMRFASAPKPQALARSGHACVCRGGPSSPSAGGAPAPAYLRQLIRRPEQRPARAA